MTEKRVPKANLVEAACRAACPAGIDVPRYIRCIAGGRFDEALAVIRERIPFPSICGYACYSPCEDHCGSGQFGRPIAIRALKRAAAEKGGELWRSKLTVAPSTGKRAAVIGSGPSGLTATYYLAVLGHQVTVFEAQDKAGGMMRYGIPGYRLPKEVLDREIDYLKEMGVVIKTGSRVESVDQLLDQGFEAVYLACGAPLGSGLGLAGEDLPGVTDGISYLRRVNEGQRVDLGSRVAVIGGGNTAFDAARSARRLGAAEVTVYYRRSAAEMTAYEEEVAAAGEEGVRIEFLTAPVGLTGRDGVVAVTFTRMKLGKPDASGRPRPVPIGGSEFKREFEAVITAVGQKTGLTESLGVSLTGGGLVRVEAGTQATDKPGVFAGGDVVTGPDSIIGAIAQGRAASSAMDRHLGGTGLLDQVLASPEEEVVVLEYELADQDRAAMPCRPLDERLGGFGPVELGLSQESALSEAARCRSCDARNFEVTVFTEACKECGYCAEVCGVGVFAPSDRFNQKGYRPMLASHPEWCVGCGLCFYACPDFSINVQESA